MADVSTPKDCQYAGCYVVRQNMCELRTCCLTTCADYCTHWCETVVVWPHRPTLYRCLLSVP